MKTIRNKLKQVALKTGFGVIGLIGLAGNVLADENKCDVRSPYDLDGDCKITMKEYVDTKLNLKFFLYKPEKVKQEIEKLKSQGIDIVKKYEDQFKMHDTDNDGYLIPKKMDSNILSQYKCKIHPRFNPDKNCEIGLRDYLNGSSKSKNKYDFKRGFNEADTDKNGRLSKMEMKNHKLKYLGIRK